MYNRIYIYTRNMCLGIYIYIYLYGYIYNINMTAAATQHNIINLNNIFNFRLVKAAVGIFIYPLFESSISRFS